MEEKIKEIVSVFIKIPAEQIGPSTIVDRSVMSSSILLHRMYAKLADAGVTVENYTEIRNFSDLLRRKAGGSPSAGGAAASVAGAVITGNVATDSLDNATDFPDNGGAWAAVPADREDHSGAGVGIDIEAIASLPETNDFRKTGFYTMNFTPAEISYCILQPDPYASFAGLFAAKEAIVKANGDYRSKTFNDFEIGHSVTGRPTHPGFNLSISHAAGLAVGVAVQVENGALGRHGLSLPLQFEAAGNHRSGSPAQWLALVALVIALIGIVLVLFYR
jgi:holo-[acyl-carrier protein] synthase